MCLLIAVVGEDKRKMWEDLSPLMRVLTSAPIEQMKLLTRMIDQYGPPPEDWFHG